MRGLTFKKKPGTKYNYPHTDVFLGDKFLGYYLNYRGSISVNSWHFIARNKGVEHFSAPTQKQLKETLAKLVSGERVTLKSSYGVETTYENGKEVLVL